MFLTPLNSESAACLRSLLDQIRAHLLEGRVEKGMRASYRQFAPFLDVSPLVSMLGTWNQAERDRLQQLITQDTFAVNRAKVTELFRRFLEEVEEELERAGFPQEPSSEQESASIHPPFFADKKQILVLYAEKDRAHWHELQKHFFQLKRIEGIHWSDSLKDLPRDLDDDFAYHEQWIDHADKVLCLVTPNALAYPVYPLAERAALAHKLIPLKIIGVDLVDTIFAPLSSLPSDNRFTDQWEDLNGAYVDIAQQLRRFIKKLLEDS